MTIQIYKNERIYATLTPLIIEKDEKLTNP